MADLPTPALDLPVFAAGAKSPIPEQAPPVSDVAEQGPVAPPTEFTTNTEQQFDAEQKLSAEQAANEKDPNARSLFRLWADEDSSVASIVRLATAHGFAPDFNYRLPAADSEEWKKLTKGLSDDDLGALSTATSAEHAAYLADQLRHKNEVEKEFMLHSSWGRLGLGLADPINLGLMLTGVGEINDASRIARFIKGGLLASGENAALQAFLDAGKPGDSGHDVALAALQGFMLGGALHALVTPKVAALHNDEALRATRELDLNRLEDAIEQGRVPADQVRPEVLAEIEGRRAERVKAESADRVTSELEHQRAEVAADVHSGDTAETHAATEEKLKGAQEDLQRAQEEHAAAPKETPEASPKAKEDTEHFLELTNEDLKRVSDGEKPAPAEKLSPTEQKVADAKKTVEATKAELERSQRSLDAQKRLAEHDAAVAGAEGNPHALVKLVRDERTRNELTAGLSGERTPVPVNPEAPMPGNPEHATGETFGADSASAARAGDVIEPAVELTQGHTPVPQSSRASKLLNRGPFATFSSILRGSSNAIVRSRLGRMVGEAVAARGANAGTVGASDHASMLAHAWQGEISRIDYIAKRAWMQEKGYSGFWSRYNLKVQHEYATELGRAIRGFKTDSKALQEAAKGYAKTFANILKEAKRAGVKGFEDVESNEHYLPRVFDFDSIKSMTRLLGGDHGMTTFMADALQKGTEIDRDLAEKIARGYLMRTKRLNIGVDAKMMGGAIRLDDFEYLRGLLKEDGRLAEGDIDKALDELKARASEERSGTGSVKFAKRKVQFDETHTVRVKDADGKMVPVSIADMYNNDATKLVDRYIRVMSGETGMARVGIKSEADFQQSLAESLSSLDESGASEKEMKSVRENATAVYKLLTGKPLESNEYGFLGKSSTLLRNYAYARTMNQSGFSIANNLIRPWTNGYAKYSSKYLPAMAGIMRRDAEGELTNSLAREIERFTGTATDSINNHIWSHYEEESLMGRITSDVNHKLKVAGRVTSHISGMTPGLVWGQRMMSLGIVDRLVRAAHGDASIPLKRLAIMGLDDDMMGRIKAQLLQHAPETADSGAIRSVNWAGWTDLEARDAMLTAVHRETRILIHGEDIASTGLWMNKWWGRLFIQLRRFPMMAMSKQLARGLHMRDTDTLWDFLLTSTVGTMSFAAQSQLRSIGMNESDREAYLDKNLAPGRLIAAAIQRNPYSGMFPQVIDTVMNMFGQSAVFDARGSGLSGNIAFGIPAVDALSKINSAIGDPLRQGLRSDRRFTQKEWKAVTSALPFGNSFPMVWLTNAMADNFPKKQLGSSKHEDAGSLLDQAFSDK